MFLAFLYFLSIVAIENVTSIFTTVDLLDWLRNYLSKRTGWFGKKLYKLAICQFCQSFWLCMLFGFWFPVNPFLITGTYDYAFLAKWGLIWFSSHGLVLLLAEAKYRYLNRAPFSVTFSGRIKKED